MTNNLSISKIFLLVKKNLFFIFFTFSIFSILSYTFFKDIIKDRVLIRLEHVSIVEAENHISLGCPSSVVRCPYITPGYLFAQLSYKLDEKKYVHNLIKENKLFSKNNEDLKFDVHEHHDHLFIDFRTNKNKDAINDDFNIFMKTINEDIRINVQNSYLEAYALDIETDKQRLTRIIELANIIHPYNDNENYVPNDLTDCNDADIYAPANTYDQLFFVLSKCSKEKIDRIKLARGSELNNLDQYFDNMLKTKSRSSISNNKLFKTAHVRFIQRTNNKALAILISILSGLFFTMLSLLITRRI